VPLPVYRRSLLRSGPAELAVPDDAEELFLMFCQAVKMLAGVPASCITELLIIPFSTVFN
jgi:hypothetical protein